MQNISNYDFTGKRAIVRVDFNVPLNEKFEITDDTRIRAAIPTLKKVLEKGGDEMKSLCSTLKGSTALMFTETPNAPAKLIKEQAEKFGKPVLKAAYVQECAYVGAQNLETLCNIKSREELIGEIVTILQSPLKNVISGLQANAGGCIAGLVKTL